jgi:hypothetical protein
MFLPFDGGTPMAHDQRTVSESRADAAQSGAIRKAAFIWTFPSG